jgi:CRISPR-associated protein Cmr4
VQQLGAWLANTALPATDEYGPWKTRLPLQLVIVSDEVFRDFVEFSTEVVTRVKLELQTKTVAPGALWTEEHLPPESLLYAPLYVGNTRQARDDNNKRTAGAEEDYKGDAVISRLQAAVPARIRLGGDETVGRGLVYLRWSESYTPRAAREEVTNGTQG